VERELQGVTSVLMFVTLAK